MSVEQRAMSDLDSEWRLKVESAIQSLEAFKSGTEKDFLSVGAHLQAVHRQTSEVSTELSALVESFSPAGKDNTQDGLRQVKETSTRHLADLDATAKVVVEHFAAVRSIVDAMPEMFAVFGSMVSRLRILGMETRIETARLGRKDLGFEHLAEQVTVLSEDISTRSSGIRQSISAILLEVARNEQALLELRKKHEGLSLAVESGLNANIQTFQERQAGLTRVIESVSRQSTEMVQEIHTIVSALQFQDIARQQIEHVVTALQGAVVQPETGLRESLGSTLLVCELQRAQLSRVRAEFDDALKSVITAIEKLASNVNAMHAESGTSLGFTEHSGRTFFDDVEEQLRRVMEGIGQGQSAIQVFVQSLESVGAIVRKVRSHVEAMSEVGMEIGLLALNSRIRSAKAGDEGAALGVISQAIQQLSQAAQAHIVDVERAIGSLEEVTGVMLAKAHASDAAKGTQQGIEEVGSQLQDMIGSCHAQTHSGSAILQRTGALCAEVSRSLAAMVAAMRGCKNAAGALETVENSLASFSNDLPEEEAQSIRAEVERRLKDFERQYTMQSERDVHAAYVGKTADGSSLPAALPDNSSAEGSIELF